LGRFAIRQKRQERLKFCRKRQFQLKSVEGKETGVLINPYRSGWVMQAIFIFEVR
jgi:hypothetical protein